MPDELTALRALEQVIRSYLDDPWAIADHALAPALGAVAAAREARGKPEDRLLTAADDVWILRSRAEAAERQAARYEAALRYVLDEWLDSVELHDYGEYAWKLEQRIRAALAGEEPG